MTTSPSRILVVDDEAPILDLVRGYLEREGFTVTTAADGPSALEAVRSAAPDVVILDVMLPGIDGYSLQIKISQDASTKDLPIVVLTALEPSKTLFQKFPQVVGFMTKPFKTEDLLQTVTQALNRPTQTP